MGKMKVVLEEEVRIPLVTLNHCQTEISVIRPYVIISGDKRYIYLRPLPPFDGEEHLIAAGREFLVMAGDTVSRSGKHRVHYTVCPLERGAASAYQYRLLEELLFPFRGTRISPREAETICRETPLATDWIGWSVAEGISRLWLLRRTEKLVFPKVEVPPLEDFKPIHGLLAAEVDDIEGDNLCYRWMILSEGIEIKATGVKIGGWVFANDPEIVSRDCTFRLPGNWVLTTIAER